MLRLLQRFLQNRSGATAIEYIFIASLVSILLVAGATVIGAKTSNALFRVGNGLQ